MRVVEYQRKRALPAPDALEADAIEVDVEGEGQKDNGDLPSSGYPHGRRLETVTAPPCRNGSPNTISARICSTIHSRTRGPTPHGARKSEGGTGGRQKCPGTKPYHAFASRFSRARGEHGLKMVGTLQAIGLGGMYQRPKMGVYVYNDGRGRKRSW
jgi:hypothetical protein